MQYDLIIVGVGAIGSATAYYASAKGWKVLGIDRFLPPHDQGSSHGKTRMIREAYYEDPAYVPLLKRAYHLWQEIGKEAGIEMLRITGGLMIGAEEGALISGVWESNSRHGLNCRRLSAAALSKDFPWFRIPASEAAIWEPRAGILYPERAVGYFIRQAGRQGAAFSMDNRVYRWEAVAGGYRVFTGKGVYNTRQLLLSSGPWLQQLMPAAPLRLSVERQVQYWFDPQAPQANFLPGRFPVFLWEQDRGDMYYGFPDLGDGIKLAKHHGGLTVDPDQLSRVVEEWELLRMRAWVDQYLPEAGGQMRGSSVCMYSNTRDRHFRFGSYPGMPGVWYASVCSGHGFKFSPVMGEVLTQMIGGESVGFELGLFCGDITSGSEPAPDF